MIEATERRGAGIEPREIKQEGDAGLRITWGDQRVLKPEAVSQELTIVEISIVGRYALNFRWNDGHETGIYSFRYLRDLCEEEKN